MAGGSSDGVMAIDTVGLLIVVVEGGNDILKGSGQMRVSLLKTDGSCVRETCHRLL